MRTSWDTSVKHLVRHNLLHDILTRDQISKIPSSNISRWKHESDDKYIFSEINQVIKQEIELIKRINQSSKIKRINKAYFKLADAFHYITHETKGIKSLFRANKEVVVNIIDSIRDVIPIENALKIFNISRSTFENYKAIVIHRCNASYFNWCVKRFSNQLLPKEVQTIKSYMTNDNYCHWSKSSIYLKAVRDKKLNCALTTFYKYCRLLGFKNRPRKTKFDDYRPVKTSRPNEIWSADVTIFRTADNVKHYIHFLMDHYSKYVIDFEVSSSPSSKVIKTLLSTAYKTYKPDSLQFLTDGGSENVNTTVSNFINKPEVKIEHIVAQSDVIFSNSMIEALNKVIKHQFLFPKTIANGNQLYKTLKQSVSIYNNVRPQLSLGGYTPIEVFNGMPKDKTIYTQSFNEHKALRRQLNKENACKGCL